MEDLIKKLRICFKCGFIGIEEKFKTDGRKTYTNVCKACDIVSAKVYRNNNIDKCYEAGKKYREANRDYKRQAYRKWQLANMDKVRAVNERCRYKRYNLTKEQFNSMLKRQNDCCAICKRFFDRLSKYTTPHIDHDHKCCTKTLQCCGKCIRGLLCGPCNQYLGKIKDSLEIVETMSKYLRGR
jgi:hypothetical protein